MKNIFKISFVVLLMSLVNCRDKNQSGGGLRGYDTDVLKNWADNIIVPSYRNYQSKVSDLVDKAENFKDNPSTAELETLKNSWLDAYKAFQKTIIFNIEVSATKNFLAKSNTYPTWAKGNPSNPKDLKNNYNIQKNIDLIRNNRSNEINLTSTIVETRFRYQGFPALDYLLFGNEVDIMNNVAAQQYIVMLCNTLKNDIDTIINYWDKNKDNYINSTDQSVSGAYSATINAFIEVYEQQIRAQKVGYACGAIPNQKGEAIPDFIEAYYKGDISKELLKISLQSSQDFFNGKYYNGKGSGKSLSQILEEIGHKALVNKINGQYNVIFKKIETTSGTLKELAKQGESQPDFTQRPLFGLYSDIQNNVGNFKTRMLNALNVQVGYQDSDGD